MIRYEALLIADASANTNKEQQRIEKKIRKQGKNKKINVKKARGQEKPDWGEEKRLQ
ncbi:hypothetical protein [Methanosarcina sp. MSH10X1]|uniref:hypothetical protein n=1 Tax=Methanosarcina sp. MSH10X1 TaxID=2507075 RepID=UPI0013E3F9CE|nr:hypothetical protein [Methanosarcina sp. MSH10X1]